MGRGVGGRKTLPWHNTLGAVLDRMDLRPVDLVRRINAGREEPVVSFSTVSRIVRGQAIATVPVAKLIAEALGMTIEQAFFRPHEVSTPQEARITQLVAKANDETLALLRDARKQLGPFARKHPRGGDGIRDVLAVLGRIDDVLGNRPALVENTVSAN